MGKVIIILLYYGLFIISVGGGQINSDPAPGRSPGPPGINTINDDHGIISDSPTFLVTQDDNFSNINNDEYIDSNDNDMLSAVKNDSEKQQEIDSIKNISNNNLIINNTNTNITIDINEKYNLNNTTVDEIKANSDKIDKNQLNNLIKKSSSILYDESYDITQDTLCKNRLNDYLHRDEKIVTVESYNNNNISNNDDISLNQKKNPDKQHVEHEDHQEHQEHLKHDIKLDVIHDMFDIHHNGITCGLMYKIRISTQFPSIIEDFYVETLTDNKSRGSFVGHVLSNKLPISWFKIPFIKGKNSDKTNGNYIKKSPSSWDVDHIEDENENILKPVDRWIEQEDNESSLDEDKNSNKDDANCNENTWSENLNGKNEIFAFWMINEFCDRNDKIEFRVFFRPSTNISRNDSELFNLVVRKSFTFNIIKGCQLKLKETSGTLDYSSLPLYNIDCIVYFPSDRNISSTSQLDQQQQQQQQQSGLLMNLIRLNIPCNSGGFIKFSNNLQLCGKLEELTDNQRTYHFNINNNISILIHKNPMFNLNYKLVDYCYNMSLNDRNGSFYIKPIRTTLECYFQIHLPYGNKIDLKLITNNNSLLYKSDNNKLKNEATFENFDNFDNINNKPITTHINISLSNNNINSDNISLVNDYRENLVCNGLLIRIYDTKMYKWSYCIKELSDMKIFSLLSHTNILIIHVIKNSMKKLQFQMNSDDRLEQQPEQQYDLDLNKSITTSTLYFSYSFKPIPEIVSDCTFGWVAVQQFCVRIVDTLMSWYQGEQHCVNFGGHLASIRSENEQKAIDEFLLNSPGYQDHQAFWVGASDKNFEGDFRWTDGLPFSYANWFPGWSQHGHYNKQPNDDGLSGQDCIELRRYFRIPPSVQQSKTPLSNTYMWNDRDCNAKNYVICERPIADEPIVKNWVNDCNKTISLSKEHPRASVWSPSFPRQYPDNANCYTTVTAPSSYRIVLEFEELVIENEPGCSYDYLEITEPTVTHSNLKNIDSNFQRTSRHGGLKRNPFRKRNSYDSLSLSNNNFEMNQMNYQNLLGVFNNLYKPRSNFLIQTPDYPRGNPLYHTNKLRNSLPRRMCGDWSSKLKLLRYVSNGSYLGLHFISDYSHHYGGFKAKVFMENRGHWVRAASECSDERLKAYNGSCYLMVSYPEVDWWTAQSICRGMGSQLTSVSTPDEHRFITTAIRNQPDYSPQVIYWLGGELVNSQQFEWTDGAKMTFQGWLPGQGQFDKLPIESVCLGLQWKMSPTPMLPSGLYWDAQKCRRMGGYVCKKRKQEFDPYEVRNETVNGIEGRLISPGYPNPYPLSIDYWVRIVAPERSRIIVQFQKIDLESQDECLYDYVSVQNYETVSEISLEPGTNLIPMAMLKSDKFYDIPYGNERIDYIRRYRNADNYITQSVKNLTPLNLKSTKIKMKLKRSLGEIPKSQINNYYQKNKLLRNSFNEILQLNRKHLRKKRDFSELLNTPLVNDKINTETKHNSFEYLIKENVDNAQTFLPYVRWCGSHEANMSKFDFISSSNEVMLNFHSDYSMAGGGFAAIWKVVDISGCPLQTLTAREGIITSPNYPHFLINNLDCTFIIQAPIGRKVWLEFIDYRIDDGATIDIDIGYGNFQAYNKKDHLNEGIFISIHEQIKIQIRTSSKPRGRGFQATYKTVGPPIMERVIHLSNSSKGFLYHLNYPQMIPENIEFTQHLLAPLGAVILLEFNGVEFSQNGCADQNVLEIYDNYGDNGTKWQLCKYENHSFTTTDRNNINLPDSDTTLSMGRLRLGRSDAQQAPIFITSYLNTIHIRQRTSILTESKIILNATVHVQQDINYKLKLASGDDYVESCQPNPCQFDGKCITGDSGNRCQCQGHYTGRFCGLTMCELEPCVFGKCELTLTNFKCHCQKGYIGTTCEEKQKPCAENPCEGRGDCFEKNGRFFCRCHAWWEGQRCERKMLHIPYKPLSERMLQEPFWLGLITVFVVLGVIGLVWCAKRHFPEKIEKLLAEENDRNRPPGSVHGHHHTSLREQLQFTTSIPQTASTTSTMPGFNPPRSIFNRLGIRKPSILSLSSPNPPGGATARTFSLDDLLRPPPRRSPSPRKKRNNSTPTKKNAAEKKQILQQLISPAPTQVRPKISLGELIQMSENRMKSNCIDSESDLKETTFSENSGSASTLTARPLLNDPKLEKKVTFARLLSKVSAEMSSGSEMDGNGTRNSSALSLPTEIQYRPNSLPQSPCTNDIRSPHSTSSNQGSDSLSSSELALTDIGLRNLAQNISNNINNNNRRIRPKVSSADSILAMFRNFASTSSSGTNVRASSSVFVSPSTTPTACSPQDDAPGDDESSTSSMHTPVSFSSGAPDSPVFYRQTTIEVPVLDALSAHKVVPNTNLLHPPTILLEIPNNGINKCLSPIRELPTPMPSPALTPIMPRPRRSNSPIIQNDNDTASCSEDDEDNSRSEQTSAQYMSELQKEMCRIDSEIDTTPTDTATTSFAMMNRAPLLKSKSISPIANITIDIEPPTPEEKTPRPTELIIPTLIVQQPSPTKDRFPMIIFPGSPPPQRASIGETSFMFPNKQQQKRLLKQFEKPTSLDLPFAPPTITVTSNMSELESDIEPMSPAPNKIGGTTTLVVPGGNAVGMCYLSPFAMCTRADRTISESNLSSSGYSSMASPGTSRCGSSNPLCPNEMDESGSGPSGTNLSLHANLLSRRQSTLLASCKENITNGKSSNESGNHDRLRGRSDSETLSDDPLLESNDEGIGTDHLDEKLEDGEMKTIKELEIFIEQDLVETGKNILNSEESLPMSQLQLPSIVIQSDGNDRGLSPVSSRSESPLSERASMGRFSPHFYGRKDQQLPFTDSDGLYDFPSSDGKGTLVTHQRRSSKKRERKSSKTGLTQSPTRNQNLDLPTKEANISSSHNCSKHFHHLHHSHHGATITTRKSPKRRPIQRHPVESSSSSTESLTSARELTFRAAKGGSPSRERFVRDCGEGSGDDTGEDVSSQILPNAHSDDIVRPRKISRLKAIGNQIRFLRRLEQSIKQRDRLRSPSDSCPEDDLDSPRITSPLLKNVSTKSRISLCRQKRLPTNLYSTTTLLNSSEHNNWRTREKNIIHGDINSD